MITRIAVFLTLTALVGVATSRAQDSPATAELYGSGVHAYFSNDLGTAIELFTQAIASSTEDPRVYYFRAMALRKMGRRSEADQDLEIGASLEVADADGYYPVDSSIERLQGEGRIALEQHRRQARFAATQARRQSNQQRYEATQRAESQVLRKRFEFGTDELGVQPAAGRTAAPLTPGQQPSPPGVTPAEEAVRNAPPVDIPALEPDSQADSVREAAPAKVESDSPFGEDPDETAADDPFGAAAGDDRGAGMKDAPVETPAETDPFSSDAQSDPFGGSEADADPFGGESEPAADPSGTEDGGAEDDPFSAAAGAPTNSPDAANTPADASAAEQPGKIKAGKLAGILGRAIGSAIPNPPKPPALPLGGPSPPTAGDRPNGGGVEDVGPTGEAGGEAQQEDPFAEDSGESDPFAEPPGNGGESDPFAEPPGNEGESDPFAEPPESESDPFAEPAAPAEEEMDPFAEPSSDAEGESDPFAEPAQTDENQPVNEEPTEADNPFGN